MLPPGGFDSRQTLILQLNRNVDGLGESIRKRLGRSGLVTPVSAKGPRVPNDEAIRGFGGDHIQQLSPTSR